jgi:hypothetical protein
VSGIEIGGHPLLALTGKVCHGIGLAEGALDTISTGRIGKCPPSIIWAILILSEWPSVADRGGADYHGCRRLRKNRREFRGDQPNPLVGQAQQKNSSLYEVGNNHLAGI